MIKLFGKAITGLMLVLAVICFINISSAKAQPGVTVTFQTFYDELGPFGQWIEDPDYGYVWIPDVDQDFKPYATAGHWVETEYGNTWVSDYDWGWAPFHYGRWRYDDNYGWEWIPGTEWGPAWVNWRTDDDYYGWAPLGPGVDIDMSLGTDYYAPDNYWVFVPSQYVCSPYLNQYYLPSYRNTSIIRNTRIINNTFVNNNRRYISGPRPAELQRYTGGRINVYTINNNRRPGRTSIRNNTLNLYRPEITNRNDNNRAIPNRVVGRGNNPGTVNNGFGGRNNSNNNLSNGNLNNNRGNVQGAASGNVNGNNFGRPARSNQQNQSIQNTNIQQNTNGASSRNSGFNNNQNQQNQQLIQQRQQQMQQRQQQWHVGHRN